MSALTFDALRRVLEKFPVLTDRNQMPGIARIWNDGWFYTIRLEFSDTLIAFEEDTSGPEGLVPFTITDGQLVYTGHSVLSTHSPFTLYKKVRLS